MKLPVLCLFALVVWAHSDKAGKAITLAATVVDTGCYLGHGATGDKHVSCAAACARAGVALALLDSSTGTLYLPVAMDHKNPNPRLLPFVEKRVKVTGILHEKGGMKGIMIKTIEASK